MTPTPSMRPTGSASRSSSSRPPAAAARACGWSGPGASSRRRSRSAAPRRGPPSATTRLYLEKWLEDNRHVEVQVAVDRFGHGVHLGERDCSVQRRHQKILEEAPTPALGPAARADLAERALAAVVAAGYENVGTLEFLVDGRGDFYFIEINCRIQVEHPVTEVLSGIDLVVTQIRIAAGEPLGFSQADIALRGHAIEFRINAEDPAHEFRPSAGIIERFVAPGGPGVRLDSHAYAGYDVPPFYDSLLGKLIVWGPDRPTAIARSPGRPRRAPHRGPDDQHLDPRGAPRQRDVPRGSLDDEPPRPGRQRGVPRGGEPGVMGYDVVHGCTYPFVRATATPTHLDPSSRGSCP